MRIRTKFKIAVFVAASAVLGACTNTGAIKIAPDTYKVSTRVPFTGGAGAEGEALQTAGQYCQSLNKELLVQRSENSECALHGGCGQASVTFSCLAKGS
jgi:hypothetical protein